MDWSNMDKKTTLNNVLNILYTRFHTFQDEIELFEDHLESIGDALSVESSIPEEIRAELGVDWDDEYEKSYQKIQDLEIEQGKTQDKIDSVLKELRTHELKTQGEQNND